MATVRMIRLKATVQMVRPGKVVVVRLRNGHEVAAFASRSTAVQSNRLCPGDSVLVEMSPCDMSSGRLRFE